MLHFHAKAVDTMQRMYAAGVGASVLGVAMGGGGSRVLDDDRRANMNPVWVSEDS